MVLNDIVLHKFGKRLSLEILGRKKHFRSCDGPLYSELRVVESQCVLALWCIHIVDLILELCSFAQHHKPMGKSAWDKQLTTIIGA